MVCVFCVIYNGMQGTDGVHSSRHYLRRNEMDSYCPDIFALPSKTQAEPQEIPHISMSFILCKLNSTQNILFQSRRSLFLYSILYFEQRQKNDFLWCYFILSYTSPSCVIYFCLLCITKHSFRSFL